MSARANAGELIARADAVLLDVDGVICLEDEPIAGAAEAVASLRSRVPLLVAVTNDSRRTRVRQHERLARVGLTGARVATAIDALAAELLAQRHYVVAACGTPSLTADLRRLGVDVDPTRATALAIGAAANPSAVADGRAMLARGLPAFAANADLSIPTLEGRVPDTGAVVAALGCLPTFCGKPNEPMSRIVHALIGDAARVVVIGDGIDTDLAWARAEGWASIYIGEGEGGDVDADAVVPSIAALATATP